MYCCSGNSYLQEIIINNNNDLRIRIMLDTYLVLNLNLWLVHHISHLEP